MKISQFTIHLPFRYVFSVVVPSGTPLNVTFTYSGKRSLKLSWNAPHECLWNGKLTGYLVCHSDRAKAGNPKCSERINALKYTIINLQPSTKYFVTVSVGTSVGFGPKSAEISKITDGGKNKHCFSCMRKHFYYRIPVSEELKLVSNPVITLCDP